ncbi:MAG: hypothetical protein HC850_01610 [Rhodomicrobium sp.]|nr:hypothetical protein [Rhodomicrobium sp.]
MWSVGLNSADRQQLTDLFIANGISDNGARQAIAEQVRSGRMTPQQAVDTYGESGTVPGNPPVRSTGESITLQDGTSVAVPPRLTNSDPGSITETERQAFHNFRRQIPESFLNSPEGRQYLAAGLPETATLGDLIDFAVRDVGSQPLASQGEVNWSDMHELHLLFASSSARGEAGALSAIVSNIPRDAEPFGQIFGLGPESFRGQNVYSLVKEYLEFHTDTRVNRLNQQVSQLVERTGGQLNSPALLNQVEQNLSGAGLLHGRAEIERWQQFRADLMASRDRATTERLVTEYFDWARNFIRPSLEELTEGIQRGLAMADYLGVNQGQAPRYDQRVNVRELVEHLNRMEREGRLPTIDEVRQEAERMGITLRE